MGSGRVDPHRTWRAHQPDLLKYWLEPELERYVLFGHFTWCGSTSLLPALKTSLLPWVLAGSIPTEIGKLINMQKLHFKENRLSGPQQFPYFAWCGSTSLPLALKPSLFAMASGRVDTHRVRRAHQPD